MFQFDYFCMGLGLKIRAQPIIGSDIGSGRYSLLSVKYRIGKIKLSALADVYRYYVNKKICDL